MTNDGGEEFRDWNNPGRIPSEIILYLNIGGQA